MNRETHASTIRSGLSKLFLIYPSSAVSSLMPNASDGRDGHAWKRKQSVRMEPSCAPENVSHGCSQSQTRRKWQLRQTALTEADVRREPGNLRPVCLIHTYGVIGKTNRRTSHFPAGQAFGEEG